MNLVKEILPVKSSSIDQTISVVHNFQHEIKKQIDEEEKQRKQLEQKIESYKMEIQVQAFCYNPKWQCHFAE
jgi:peptidoglycan hydrolase CwlO-like protein